MELSKTLHFSMYEFAFSFYIRILTMRRVSDASSGSLLRSTLAAACFGLLLFYMSIPRTRTSEHLHHGRVQQMLAAVCRLILDLIV